MDRSTPTRTDLDAVFREAVHVSRVPMVVTDPRQPDNPAIFVNDAFLRLTGYEAAEVLGHNLRLMQGPDTDPDAVARIRAALAAREALTVDILNYRRDGTAFWCALFISPVFDAAGVLTHYFASQLDVTEQKTADELRRAQHEQMQRQIAESIPQLVFAAGPDGLVDYYNSRWYHFTGTAPGETEGEAWHRILHPEDLARTTAAWQAALAGGGLYEIEYRLRRADGQYRWFLGRGTPLRDPATGAIIRWLGTCTDIEDAVQAREALARSRAELERLVCARTAALEESNARLVAEAAERAKAEAALRQSQKMQAIGHLAGGVAHDFNNLLTVVLGGLDHLDRKLGAAAVDPAELPRLRRAVTSALAGATRAATLTQRLLAFSRQQALDPQTVAANRLVGGMLDLLGRTLGEAVQIETALAPELWLTHADPNQLENALLNLAVNARDAMPAGGRLLITTANTRLDAVPGVAAGDYVLLAVRDSGTGMDAATLSRCFDPFFTTKESGQGTGLGLSQVFGFARQSYGHVEIESAPGAGTTVKLFLPRADHLAAGETPPIAASAAPPGAAHGATVLVVEDDPDVRGFTTEALRELGYRVLETATAAAALDILDRQPEIALLFTDLVLPGGQNGRDLAVEARHRRPDLHVLLTTGYGGHAQARPDPELLEKPFTYAELAATLGRFLG